MQRWTNMQPLVLPIPFESLTRLDLEFINVHRDTGSFTAFVFLNADDLKPEASRDHRHFAGSFSLFSPDYCWGVDDHCEWRKGPVSPFDRRPPHHLTPANISMDVTDAIQRLGDPSELFVTVHAQRASDPDATDGVIRFERLQAVAYQ